MALTTGIGDWKSKCCNVNAVQQVSESGYPYWECPKCEKPCTVVRQETE